MDILDADRNELVKISKLYYICNLIRIYLAIRFYMANQVLYFIIFWIHFGLDKFVGLYLADLQFKSEQIKMICTDVFQIGFFYFSQGKSYKLERIYFRFLMIGLFPAIFYDSFFLFGRDMLESHDMIAVDLFLAYVIFLGELLLTAVMVLQMEFVGYEHLIKYIQIIFTGYLTTTALIQISNYFYLCGVGVNIFSFIVTFYMIKSKDDFLKDLFKQFFCVFFMIPFSRVLFQSLIHKKFITIILYLYTALRLIFLIIFAIEDYISRLVIYDKITSGYQIVLVNQFIALVSSMLSLVYEFKNFKTAVKNYKIFFIHSQETLSSANQDLHNKCCNYTNIEIYLVSKRQIISTLGYRQFQNDEICKCSSSFCKQHYELIKNIIVLNKRKNVQIEIISLYDYPMCTEQQFMLLKDEEVLPEYYFNTFKLYEIQDKYLYMSLLERYFKGYFSGNVSEYIYKILKRTSQQKIRKIKQDFLYINAFLKHLKDEINFLSYQQILYDLNEF